mmetsp:Transcript_86271/g.230404  ORF Transcript_86271/g.230404 Transcript_86271/m.230404 type:complete len:344 (+) Transcript_86271:249-1280(+)
MGGARNTDCAHAISAFLGPQRVLCCCAGSCGASTRRQDSSLVLHHGLPHPQVPRHHRLSAAGHVWHHHALQQVAGGHRGNLDGRRTQPLAAEPEERPSGSLVCRLDYEPAEAEVPHRGQPVQHLNRADRGVGDGGAGQQPARLPRGRHGPQVQGPAAVARSVGGQHGARRAREAADHLPRELPAHAGAHRALGGAHGPDGAVARRRRRRHPRHREPGGVGPAQGRRAGVPVPQLGHLRRQGDQLRQPAARGGRAAAAPGARARGGGGSGAVSGGGGGAQPQLGRRHPRGAAGDGGRRRGCRAGGPACRRRRRRRGHEAEVRQLQRQRQRRRQEGLIFVLGRRG